MKSKPIKLLAGALLLVWSLRSDAHDSFEAMQAGGSLLKITAALLHPLLEIDYLPALPIVTLTLLLLGYTKLHRRSKSRRLTSRAWAKTTEV